MADSMNLRDQRAFVCGNAKAGAQPPRAKGALESLHKFVYSFSGARGNGHAARKSPEVGIDDFTVLEIIDLIENDQSLFAESVQLFDHGIHGLHLLVHPRMAQIDNVNEQ